MASEDTAEPFPTLSQPNTRAEDPSTRGAPEVQTSDHAAVGRTRASSTASSNNAPTRNRGASLLQSFINSNPPLGMWQATGEVGSKFPTLGEIRNGSFADEGWSHEGQLENRGADPHDIHRRRIARTSSASQRTRGSALPTPSTPGAIPEEREAYFPAQETLLEESSGKQAPSAMLTDEHIMGKVPDRGTTLEKPGSSTSEDNTAVGPDQTGTYPNGYRFPKKHTWGQSTVIGLKAFWKFVLTPFGFIITIYGLNVVGWGAMIFFVLLNAAPAMCHPSCNDLYSARKIWIEIDSQVLTALFCVTGFGLIPWRFRDLYFLMRWRLVGDQYYFRKLAGINRGWFRLPRSDKLPDHLGPPPVYNKKNPQTPESPAPYSAEEISTLESNQSIPIPVTSMPDAPLTGIRAQPTKPWLIDVVVWMYAWNTFIQAGLCGIMWGMTRFNRPSWATGFLITVGCVVAIVAGIVVFIEGSKIKKIEGIPVHEYDVLESIEDAQTRMAKEEAKRKKSGHAKKSSKEDLTLQRVDTKKLKGKHWYARD